MSALRLHSLAAAERELGIRHGTLAPLAKSGAVRAVPWGHRLKIPAAELARLAAEGIPAPGTRRRGVRRAPRTADPAALRAMRVEDL